MKKIFLLLFLLLGFVSIAGAIPVYYSGAGYGDWDVDISFDSVPLAGNPYYAGQILLTTDGNPDPFAVYCLSLQYKIDDTEAVVVKLLSTLTSASDPDVVAGSGAKAAWLLNTYAPGVNSNFKGAALQLSLWEVLYDTSYDLSSGRFQVTSADSDILTIASSYLASIGANTDEAIWVDAVNSSRTFTGQDFGIQGPLPGPIPGSIPEPGSLLLLGTGIGALCLGYSRRRK